MLHVIYSILEPNTFLCVRAKQAQFMHLDISLNPNIYYEFQAQMSVLASITEADNLPSLSANHCA